MKAAFVSVSQGLATDPVLAHTAEALSLVAGMILVCAKHHIPRSLQFLELYGATKLQQEQN